MSHGSGFRRIWWLPPLPVGARVFEIGYGAGDFRREAEARYWLWDGCDPIDGTMAENADWPYRTYDAVVGWQSLEHCIDPETALHGARRALKLDGYLVVAVPNIRCLERWLWGTRWDGWRLDEPDPLMRHRWHWSARTLSRLLVSCGFRVESVLYQRIAKQLPGGIVTGTILAALGLSSRMTIVARPA